MIVLALLIGVVGPIYLVLKYNNWSRAVEVTTELLQHEKRMGKDQHPAVWAIPYAQGDKEWSSLSCYQMFLLYNQGERDFPVKGDIGPEYDHYKTAMIQCFWTASFVWFLVFWSIVLAGVPCFLIYARVRNTLTKKSRFAVSTLKKIRGHQGVNISKLRFRTGSVLLQGMAISIILLATKVWSIK
jgi:hypothetical protein